MEINKEIIDFQKNKITYIKKLREIITNDILKGNNKHLINTLKAGDFDINDFSEKIKKNKNWGVNYEMSTFSLIYNCQISVVCYEKKSKKLIIYKIIYGNYCIWLYYNYYSENRNTDEHYKCLIPNNNKRIVSYESYIEMRDKIINDLKIYNLEIDSPNNNYEKSYKEKEANENYESNQEKEEKNTCNNIIGQKLDKNLFYENDYIFNDNNCLNVSFCDFIQTNHSLYTYMRKLIEENNKELSKINKNITKDASKSVRGIEKDINAFQI